MDIHNKSENSNDTNPIQSETKQRNSIQSSVEKRQSDIRISSKGVVETALKNVESMPNNNFNNPENEIAVAEIPANESKTPIKKVRTEYIKQFII